MLELIKKEMIVLDDLQFITQKMLQELLREIDINDLALCMRIANNTTQKFILTNVSSGIKSDILDSMKSGPISMDKIESAQNKVMKVVRKKFDKGELIFNKSGQEKFV